MGTLCVVGHFEAPPRSRSEALELLRPRIKNPRALKTLSDDALGFMEAALAAKECGCTGERAGVIVALDRLSWGEKDLQDAQGDLRKNLQPLWLLKHLPNTPAAQIAIELGATGPCQTVIHSDHAVEQATTLAEDWLRRGEAERVLVLFVKTVSSNRTFHSELMATAE